MPAERVTREDLERIAETVSESLPNSLRVFVQHRYNYYGLDLYDAAGMVDTLTTGTKRELYTYLQGMLRTFLLQSSAWRHAA